MKTIVITGATSGIGLETVLKLKDDYQFVVGVRDLAKAAKLFSEFTNVAYYYLDLTDLNSIKDFSNYIIENYVKIDILINNGGVFHPPYTLTYNDLELQFAVNYMSHFYLTYLLLPHIKSKVITVSSIAHRSVHAMINYDDINFKNGYSKWRSYQQSKLACMLFGLKLDRFLKDNNSNVISIVTHPGVSLTNIIRSYPYIVRIGLFIAQSIGYVQNSQMGSLATNYAITSDDLVGGEYIGPYKHDQRSGPVKILEPSLLAQNTIEQDKLWNYSSKLLNINYEIGEK